MKTRFTLLFLLQWLVLPLFALDFSSNASLYDHLLEINQAWRKQAPPPSSSEYVHFNSEQARIQVHLQWVEAALRTRDGSNLTEAARVNRRRHLDRLNAYRSAGQFPANQYHAYRQPYFRDSYGVLCAVGYLLWQDGQHELVQRINRENNYAYIAELAIQYPIMISGMNGYPCRMPCQPCAPWLIFRATFIPGINLRRTVRPRAFMF